MAESAANSTRDKMQWLVLITVMVGTFLGRLDQTIVNLALPKIIQDYSISVSQAGWIATAYIIANAVFVPVWGKLGDTIGRKRVYIVGFLLFIAGSVLAGFAWNLTSMIVFRVIQAIAGSADYPSAMAIIAVTFRNEKDRTQALGIWSASFAAATVFGPLVGGPLIDNFGWRSVFLVNLPVGIVGLVMALTFIKESVSERKPKSFDWWGSITLGVALAAIVLVLDQGKDWGWLSSSALACYASTVIFTYLFINIEHHQEEPIVDLKFFRNAIFLNTLGNNFIVFMGMMGCVFLIPVFAQTFLGYNATQTGYLFMPMAFAMMPAAAIGGKLTGKIEPRYIIASSTFIAGVGLYFFSFLDPRSGVLDIIIPLAVMAFGMGFGMAPRTSAITAAVPIEEVGIASSILALARNVAGAFGIALSGTILQNATESKIFDIARNSMLHATNPLDRGIAIGLMQLKAQIVSYRTVFIVSTIVLLIGAVLSLYMKIEPGKMSSEKVFVE
jgi:EmrB/QacA subfamily drug resistance transporter